MIQVKIGSDTVSLPEGWQEVTFEKLYKFMGLKDANDFDVLSIMANIESVAFEKIRLADALTMQNAILVWINEPVDFTQSFAPNLWFREKFYQMPDDIGSLPIGIYKDLQSEITALGNEPTNLQVIALYPLIVASYLQYILDGEYDYKKAEILAVEIKQKCAGLEVLAFGNFFLNNLALLKNGSPHLLHQANPTNIANLANRQDTMNSPKTSGFRTRLKNWFLQIWSTIQKGSAK